MTRGNTGDSPTRWAAGKSGNPAGGNKPRSPVAQLREQVSTYLPELLNRVMLQALSGDTTAQRLLLDRCFPVLKAEGITVEMSSLSPHAPMLVQGRQILAAVASGEIPPDVGSQLLAGVAQLAGLKQVDELEERIRKLEGHTDDPDDLT